MERAENRLFSVKVILRWAVRGRPVPERLDEHYSEKHTYFEERVMLVRAATPAAAYELVERRLAEDYEYVGEYTNMYGQKVHITALESIKCFEVADDPSEVMEVYSHITALPMEMSSVDYLQARYNYALADDAENERREAQRIEALYMLRDEAFSPWRSDREKPEE